MNATTVTKPARQEHNCNAWSLGDAICCSAERSAARQKDGDAFDPEREITILEARKSHHYRGGKAEGGIVRPNNTEICTVSCRERCLNG